MQKLRMKRTILPHFLDELPQNYKINSFSHQFFQIEAPVHKFHRQVEHLEFLAICR